MIKSIELWNWENHEHTLVNDLSAGFNLIFGESNAGKCLTGDSVVVDDDGSMRTILDMFNQGEWRVPSIQNGRFSMEKVSCIVANGDKEVFELATSRGRSIKATGNHRFFTPYGWRDLDTLKPGDWVAIARRVPVFGSRKLPEGHARLIGYLLGDGGTTGAVNFTNEEDDVLQDFKKLVLSLGDHHFVRTRSGNAWTLNPSKPLGAHNRNIGKSGIAKFCDTYGLSGYGHKEKHIPKVLFTCHAEDLKEVIRGLLITDGWVCKRKNCNSYEVGFSTTSKALSRDLAHLLTRFGVVSTLRRKKTTWTHKGAKKRGFSYSVEVHGRRFVCLLGEVLGFDFAGKKAGLLHSAINSHDMDRIICRYDVVPRTEETIEIVRRAVSQSGKSESEIREEMGLHPQTSLSGSSANNSFGLTFLEMLAKSTGSVELQDIVESDLYWDKVKNINSVGVEPTFDVEVPTTHSFLPNDIYAHNTSIIRAIKLVAYNEFNPKCIRVGSKTCSVEVKTDKGRVKVTRPSNEWEVEKNGSPTQYFEKIGKVVLPEVSEILGMSMVQLGDVEFPVNVMNQLEGHFMLSELNGKTASGSVRAQIIDEISGLAGIEGIIKEVSLDNHRWGREVKTLEDRMEEQAADKHDPAELAAEEALLAKVGEHITHHKECTEMVEVMTKYCDAVVYEGEEIERLERDIKALPDDKEVKGLLDTAEVAYDTAKGAAELLESHQDATEEAQNLEEELNRDIDTDAALEALETAREAFDRARVLKSLWEEVDTKRSLITDVGDKVRDAEDDVNSAEQELDKVLASIKVCPLTQMPFRPGGCGSGKITGEDWQETETASEPEPEPELEVEKFDDDIGDGLFDGL